MYRWRNRSTAVSSDGQRAKIPHNYRGPSFTSVSFSPGWRGREKQRQLTPLNNSVLAKNPWRSWIFSAILKSARFFYQPRRTTRVTSEILKMNLTLRYFLSPTLKLASNQLHTSSSSWCQGSHSKLKGTMIEFLSKMILTATTSVTWRSKFSAVVLQLQCASAIITPLDDSNWNAFQTFWPRLNILRVVDIP